MNSVFNLSAQMQLDGIANCLVVARDVHLAAVRAALQDAPSGSIRLEAREPAEALDRNMLDKVSVLVIEIDPNEPRSLDRVAQVADRRPDLAVIAAIENASVAVVRTLLKRGVRDVVTLPFDRDELFNAVIELGSNQPSSQITVAPMAAVLGSAGGVGATTVITHLAEAIAGGLGEPRCCIIDFNIQFGEVAALLGQDPATNILDLIEADQRLDQDMIRDAALDTGRGVYVLAAPDHISPPEFLNAEAILDIVALARREFDYVLLDLPANWTNWSLSAACAADRIIILTDNSIRTLRQAKKCVNLLDSVDYPKAQTKVVVNKFQKRLFGVIGTDEVFAALGLEVIATLPEHKGGLSDAQDQGLLLSDVEKRAPFVRAIDALATALTEGKTA